MDTPIWRLTKEITPSKHIIEYQYFKNTKDLERIQIKNPSGEKVFTEIKFGEFSDENKKHLSLETSENQSCTYLFGQKYKSRYLLDEVSPSSKIIESSLYLSVPLTKDLMFSERLRGHILQFDGEYFNLVQSHCDSLSKFHSKQTVHQTCPYLSLAGLPSGFDSMD